MVPIVRLVVGIISAVALIAGLVTAILGFLPALYLVAVGTFGLGIVIFERRQRYGADGEAEQPPNDRFRRTDEVFVDPSTGLRTRVWIDSESGQRTYRPE